MAVRTVDVRFHRDILERAVSAIVVENVLLSGKAARATHHRYSFPHAGRTFARRRRSSYVEVDIVGHHEIELSVAVVINERAAVAPGFAVSGYPRLLADLGEGAVDVVIETILTVVSNVKILPAVVVVIADAYALAPSSCGQTRPYRDINKRAVVVVVVEVAGRRLSGRKTLKCGAIDDEDIGPAIVVVIEDGDAGTGGLNNVFLCTDAAENGVHRKASLLSDVNEVGYARVRSLAEQRGRENADEDAKGHGAK